MSPTFLAERFWPGITETRFQEVLSRAAASSDNPQSGGIRYLGSILVPSDEIVLAVIGGPSAEAVRADAERAGLRWDRIVESIQHGFRGAHMLDKQPPHYPDRQRPGS